MVMIPGFYGAAGFESYIEAVKYNLEFGNLTEERLNDAVARILAVKLAMGIVEKKSSNIRI